MIIPIITILRIPNEEEVLKRELPGYEEYMQKVKHRLVPGIW
jgi:protein-S-isoprenylcysteine O-methyltransferase Ste14